MSQTVPPETVALVRHRYADGVPVARILADTGIGSIGVLYRCLDGQYDDGSGAPQPLPKIQRRRGGLRIMRTSSRRKSLVARIWRNAEAQVEQIEARLAQHGMAIEDFERDARSLAIVVRTLRELATFDAAKRGDDKRGNDKQQQKPANDEPVPRDIGELRRVLAEKLEGLVRDQSGAGE